MEGIPLHAWSPRTFSRIASKWGELLFSENSKDSNRYSVHFCIKTNISHLILESFKVILDGKVKIVRAKEITG